MYHVSNIKLELLQQWPPTENERDAIVGQELLGKKIIPVSADNNVKVRAKLIAHAPNWIAFRLLTPFWHLTGKGMKRRR